MIKKIISSGQTGAGQAALDAAITLGIPYGGWISTGRRTEDGILPHKYKLKELKSASHPNHTERNVMDADGTLIFSHGKLIGGSAIPRKLSEKHKKPCLHLDLNIAHTSSAASIIDTWIALYKIKTLYVVGSKASKDPEIYENVKYIMEGVILLGLSKTGLDEYPENLPAQPKTVDEAVDQLISVMPLKDRVIMASLKEEEPEVLNFSPGIYIIDNLVQNGVNKELYESCCAVSGNVLLSEEEGAFVIVDELWKRLQATHRLRTVK